MDIGNYEYRLCLSFFEGAVELCYFITVALPLTDNHNDTSPLAIEHGEREHGSLWLADWPPANWSGRLTL